MTEPNYSDDTPEALEARCWALRDRADKAEAERDKALAACAEMREVLQDTRKYDMGHRIPNEWFIRRDRALDNTKSASL